MTFLTRELLEVRERRVLARFALFAGDSRGRRHPEPEDALRTCWQRDRDRIVHCAAFRRLEYKTQVFVFHEGDHFRTRLTHTLEVAQIARSVAAALGLNETFVEALALTHDLGHPPFGHQGGEALHAKLVDHGGFEHNLQALRIVDQLERRYPDFPGLNLTYELREGILKHGPAGAGKPDAGTAEFVPMRPPALETVLVDLCDSAAYDHHDLDDGLTSGLLELEPLAAAVPIVGECLADAKRRHPAATERDLRLMTVNLLVKRMILDLVETSARRLEAAAPDSSDAARSVPGLIGFSDALAPRLEALEDHLFTHFYRHEHVVRSMDAAKRVLSELFDAYLANPSLLPADARRRGVNDGLHRTVCDYVAGMTDRFAEQEHRRVTRAAGGASTP